MRRFFTLAVMTTVVGMFCVSFNLPVRGQQPQPQAQPGPGWRRKPGAAAAAMPTTKPSWVPSGPTVPGATEAGRCQMRRTWLPFGRCLLRRSTGQ